MPNATVRANAQTLPEPTSHPDAELLALGPEIEAADLAYKQRVCETDAAEHADYDVTMEAQQAADGVVLSIRDEKIVSTRAHTLSGLIFKARYAATHFENAYDENVMASIVDDLLALDGDRDAAYSHDIQALAANFEAAWAAETVIFKEADGTDEEGDAAIARVREVAQKIVALPATDMALMRLKARVYLWAESTDFETFADEYEGTGLSEGVLASLFRDLGADRALDLAPTSAGVPVDPIFAAIAQHIVARDALIEAMPRADKAQAERDGREVTKADEDAVEALNLDEEAAFLELFVIVPTTLEGRRALLQHFVQRDEDGISDPIGEIAAQMLRLPMFAKPEARS
jgi:hypothetical protein